VERFLTDLLEEQRSWHAKAQFRAAMGGRAPVEPPERRVLVMGHATTNRILISVALGVDIRGYRRRFAQDQCNLTVLRWDADGVPAAAKLLLLNDTQHLRTPDTSPWG
jgi:broad specificity phosphatase PhoE